MKKNKKHYYYIILIILFISIGFAYLSANLDVMGIAHIKKVKWNIYFDNVKNVAGDKFLVTAPTTSGTSTTSLDFKVQLEDPGDSYSFNVDIINDGTVDAMVNLITKSSIADEDKTLFSYDITYSDGTPIETKNFLGAGHSDTVTVTVTYNRNIDIADLPSADKEISFNIQLEYQQAKDADDRENSDYGIIKDLSGNNNHGKFYGVVRNDDGTIYLDGNDHYVNCGLGNYDFKNSGSLVIRFKLHAIGSENNLITNWETAGLGLMVNYVGFLHAGYYIKEKNAYYNFVSDTLIEKDVWYTAVTTYDGEKIKLYLNGSPVSIGGQPDTYELAVTGNIKPTVTPFAIGANPYGNFGTLTSSSNATFESALIFDRALSDDEIASDYAFSVKPTNKEDLLLYYDFSK